MESGTQQSFLTELGPEIKLYARRLYGDQPLYKDCTLLQYHEQLSEAASSLAMQHFSSMNDVPHRTEIEGRVLAIKQAGLLYSSISLCDATADSILAVSSSAAVAAIAACTPDCRLYAPRRIVTFLRLIPGFTIDSKILLLSDCRLTIQRDNRRDKYKADDLLRILNTLQDLKWHPLLAEVRSRALTEL